MPRIRYRCECRVYYQEYDCHQDDFDFDFEFDCDEDNDYPAWSSYDEDDDDDSGRDKWNEVEENNTYDEDDEDEENRVWDYYPNDPDDPEKDYDHQRFRRQPGDGYDYP